MKKNYLGMACALGLMASLAGCSSSEEVAEAPTTTQEAPAAPVMAPVSLSADLLFDFDSATLKTTDAIDEAVSKATAANLKSITIVGHTDSVGTDEYNQKLSEERAQAVADYLTGKGFDASLISVSGEGEASPVASNDTTEGRAQNRRADVSVTIEIEQPAEAAPEATDTEAAAE
ncbi:OmpA family protein [Vibrio rumoiensis]|uniref:OmpA family protein n=1 Tax=Vibrio rumoiensis TaxID=76258 RepID=A0ABW7IVF4_9VIBR|nr:OmpA family protein [Vibrio rumoiensis]